MPFQPFNDLSSRIFGEAQGSQGHSLVELYIVADLCRLADNYSRPVIDKKAVSYGRSGVDIYPGQVM